MRRRTATIWRWGLALGAATGVLCVAGFLWRSPPPRKPEAAQVRTEPTPALVLEEARVRVVGPDQRPMPGVLVHVHQPRAGLALADVVATTDASGEARLPRVALGHARLVALRQPFAAAAGEPESSLAPPFLDVSPPARTLESRWTQVVAANVVGLRVDAVDAETGAILDHQGFTWHAAGHAGHVEAGCEPLRVHLPARPGELLACQVRMDPVAGYVQWDQDHFVERLSAYARCLAMRVPLRPTASIELDIRDHEGQLAEGAQVWKFEVGGRSQYEPTCVSDTLGSLHLRGVPHLPGEWLRIWVSDRGGAAQAVITHRLAAELQRPVLLEVQLPRPDPNQVIRIGGGAGGSFRSRCCSLRVGQPPELRDAQDAQVQVEVLRHDGQPAVGAVVTLGQQSRGTDASGLARFKPRLAGLRTVTVRQPGLQPITQTIEVSVGQYTKASLREPKGRRLEVEVVDAEGRPLPFARVETVGGEWVDEVGGIQFMDRFCDHQGRRTFARLPGAVWALRVGWGARSERIAVPALSQQSLRVVLTEPVRKP